MLCDYWGVPIRYYRRPYPVGALGQSYCANTDINNDGDVDPSARSIGTTLENGTVFRVVQFNPGVTPRNHRTDSIDYAVVMSGEIDMELDDTVVHLKAGDVLIQQGTNHAWLNRGPGRCRLAMVFVDAQEPARLAETTGAHQRRKA